MTRDCEDASHKATKQCSPQVEIVHREAQANED